VNEEENEVKTNRLVFVTLRLLMMGLAGVSAAALSRKDVQLRNTRTGSYPQIHHQKELAVNGGSIRCSTFTDVNGREHDDWIPAFKLYHRVA
jgi:hypothetical protein